MNPTTCPCACHHGGLDTPCDIPTGCWANHKQTTDQRPVIAAIDELIEAVGWLAASLLPGNTRIYRPELSDEQLTERAQAERLAKALEKRQETRAGMLVPLGETPAPMDLAVMDLLVEILEFAVPWSTLAAPCSEFEDPRRYLRSARAAVVAGSVENLTLLERGCDDWTYQVNTQLGLFGDGQLLKSPCPWCDGRTDTAPNGGQFTLRVRAVLPRGRRTMAGVDPRDVRWLVVCVGGLCEPPSRDVGTWWRGLPAWDLATEADWLADRLERTAS